MNPGDLVRVRYEAHFIRLWFCDYNNRFIDDDFREFFHRDKDVLFVCDEITHSYSMFTPKLMILTKFGLMFARKRYIEECTERL